MARVESLTSTFAVASAGMPLRPRLRVAPMLVLYADSTSERGALAAMAAVAPGAPYASLASLVRVAAVTQDYGIVPHARYEGDVPLSVPQDVRQIVVTARTQLWEDAIDVDLRVVDVHLLLAPDTEADLDAAQQAYDRAAEWAGDDNYAGAFRLVTWLAPGFHVTPAQIARFYSVGVLPPTRGAALLTSEQRAEVFEALILDHLTSAVARDVSVPRTIFPAMPFAQPLIVFHRAISAGTLEKHTYAVATCAAQAVDRLIHGLALGNDDGRSVDDKVARFQDALDERRQAAGEAAGATADQSGPDLEALFAPSVFRALGPNDRAHAAYAARTSFMGPDGTPGSRITHTRAALASAQHELQQDGPQAWAERLAATSGGVGLAAQVLRTALDRLPRSRGTAEPTIVLDEESLEPLINGIVYVPPPWYAVLPWVTALAGLTYLLLEQVVPADSALPRFTSACAALVVFLAMAAFEWRRGRARKVREEHAIRRPARSVAAWAAAWRRWLVEEGVLREQRFLLSTMLEIVVQRAAELTELHDGLLAEADRALARARGAGWNLTTTPPDAWLSEVQDLVESVSNHELDMLWREAAGDQGGAFLVGVQSNRARVAQVARAWARGQANTLSTPTLADANAVELYPRLFEGVEGSEWLATIMVAREASAFARQASQQGDTCVPRLFDDRASGWVVYSGPAAIDFGGA